MRFSVEKSPESYAIIGAAIEVQRAFGTDLLESAYGDALEIEFTDRGIPHVRELVLPIMYKGRTIKTRYRADFVCGEVLLELKASRSLSPADLAQMWHYLAVTGKQVGLLLNFGHAPLQVRRFVHGFAEPVSLDFADFAASSSGAPVAPP
jgi:GxxExxY protein